MPLDHPIPPQHKILIGLLVGAVAGLVSNLAARDSGGLGHFLHYVADPVGQVFLRLLLMIVLPLIFTSISLSLADFENPGDLARIGGKTLAIFLLITALGAILGVMPVRSVRPSVTIAAARQQELIAAYGLSKSAPPGGDESLGIGTLVGLVPSNIFSAASGGELTGVMLFAVMFGVALSRVANAARNVVVRFLDGVNQALERMVAAVMWCAPVGVAALIFSAIARFGYSMLQLLGLYLLVLMASLFIFQFVVLGILAWLLAYIRPFAFFRKSSLPMLTALATASSTATLPTTMQAASDEFNIVDDVVRFVVPLSATLSRGGTALFSAMTVLFLAQVFGIPISISTRIWLAILTTVTSLGVAGIPAGAVPMLNFLLNATGVPAAGLALVLGIEQVTGMVRTVPNVTGGMLAACIVGRKQQVAGRPREMSGGTKLHATV